MTLPEVPGYELGQQLGQGGMGTVYAARSTSDGSEWAVKVVPASRGVRLRAEADRVDHPGVVPVVAHGSHDGVVWFAMPLVHGSDLRERVPLPPAEAADVLGQVAAAVTAVHDAGLVHRDIKPANVLLDGSHALVTDFGIAAPLPDAGTESADLSWTSTDEPDMTGTLAYMPPEQWRGDPPTVRGDVYALGATLFTAITGRLPYEQRSLPELAYAVTAEPPPRTGGPFDGVIAVAMAKDPADRYPSAAAFADAVRRAAAGEKIRVPRSPNRRLLAAAGLLVLLVLAAALLWWPRDSDAQVVTRLVCAQDNHMSLRDSPAGKVQRHLQHGDRVVIDRSRDQGAWSFVHTDNGDSGWVLNQYLGDSC
ncbi:serine/threonine-protein kinase [Kutzneria kofuensis]|uniref:non-specific serine/threonine protein kinase n=1 Tax=Kutzneria kofuensis TaxID=103725 RepID=A0A7W9NKJ7_9PSEU|nr:serine/threonine-protein kinase [Kutzneria kofuensis]MBB5896105.1 serine/threonine protein kinase [Kutzneria kofuensis]